MGVKPVTLETGKYFCHGQRSDGFFQTRNTEYCHSEDSANIIINAAAYTRVDKAESEAELAMIINGVAPRVIAEEAREIGAWMIHYSTGHVFDGKATSPYKEEDSTYPLSAYENSKLAGEKVVG